MPMFNIIFIVITFSLSFIVLTHFPQIMEYIEKKLESHSEINI